MFADFLQIYYQRNNYYDCLQFNFSLIKADVRVLRVKIENLQL